MTLQEKVFIVTGGTRGIGRGIVEELASQGAKVAFTYASREDMANDLVKKLGERQVISFKADVQNLERSKEIVDQTIKKFGKLDGLVNNAGIVRDKSLMMMSASDWEDVIETNLTGTFNFCRSVIVGMMKQKNGDILNISSVAGVVGRQGQTNYAASKAGIIGLTKSLAKEVGRFNVRVNTIAPGFFNTDMTQNLDEKIRKEVLREVPMGRFGEVEEIAKLSAFLLAGDRYITGQVFCLDGGMVMA